MKGENHHQTKNKENYQNAEGQPPAIRWSKVGVTLFSSMSAAAKN
jgi:hypothetical protein